MNPFVIKSPSATQVPILLSVPHCGVEFPDEIKAEYKDKLIQKPDDTDWFVHQLYDFASSMGITMIHAVFNRWVIDLNRDPESKPLYTDGRIITALCPTTTFFGESIYKDNRKEVDAGEVKRRIHTYYKPYYNQIDATLSDLKAKFGKVLLWDCHSIRKSVPTIHKEEFPDLILGSVDGTSASPGLIDLAIKNLESDDYSFRHNYPFKGGFITRNFGRPGENQHALQLEMTKINYMDDEEINYHAERANKVQRVLRRTFSDLIQILTNE